MPTMLSSATQASAMAAFVSGEWNHEPLMFRRRLGTARTNEAERYAYLHSDEYLREISAQGCHWLRLHFYKGFGLQHEREEMALAKDLIQRCHDHGLRVHVYVQFGTLQYETLLREEPTAEDWVQIDDSGRPIPLFYVGGQSFRWMPCVNREGYWGYLRKVIDLALGDAAADGLIVDNVCQGREPDSCRCPDCRQGFVRYLNEKYAIHTQEGRAKARERFGFEDLSFVRPPAWSRWFQPEKFAKINDPVLQEWIQFRCDRLRDRVKGIHDQVRSLSPSAVLDFNFFRSWGINSAFWYGIDPYRLFPYLDAFANESECDPRFTDDGRIFHKTRANKLARQRGILAYPGARVSSPAQKRINVAESLAFNSGYLGMDGLGMADVIEFRKEHARLFAGRPVAEVTLLESPVTRAYNAVEADGEAIGIAQVLMASHVPFDLHTEDAVMAGQGTSNLVLAGCDCVPDEFLDFLRRHLENGGGLLLTGQACANDAWRRRRTGDGQDILSLFQGGHSSPAAPGQRLSPFDSKECDDQACTDSIPMEEDERPFEAICRDLGRGRLAWIPKLKFRYRPKPDENFFKTLPQEYWQIPDNGAAVAQALAWIRREQSEYSTELPAWIQFDPQRLEDGSLAVHFVNYAPWKPNAEDGWIFEARGPFTKASWYQPGHRRRDLPASCEHQRIRTRIALAGAYGILHLHPGK